MPHAKMHDESPQLPWKIDGVTGLPWFTAVHGEMAARALAHDLYVADIHLAGLGAVMAAHGAAAHALVLREMARDASVLFDGRDQLARHTGDRLLLITSRPPEEMPGFMQDVVDRMGAAGLQVDGERLPRVRVGLARLVRAPDYDAAVARLDAAILSAEFDTGPAPVPSTAKPRPAAISAVPAVGDREPRAVLASLRLDLSGLVAAATVELTFGRRRVAARSVGRNAEERRLFLIGEATARAVTELLPPGYGAVIHDVQVLPPAVPEQPRGILSIVLFLSPDGEQYLCGVASTGGDPQLAAARASLSAVNRRIEPLLVASAA